MPETLKMHDRSIIEMIKKNLEEHPAPPAVDRGAGVFVFQDDENGTVLGWPVFERNGEVAVIQAYASEGTLYPEHAHPEFETVMVFKGVMECRQNGKEPARHTPKKDPVCVFKPGELHSFYFPVRCWMIAVTIPTAEEWPHGDIE